MLLQCSSGFYIIPQENPLNRVHVPSPIMTHISPLNVTYPIVSRLVYSTTLTLPFNPAGAILAIQYQKGHFNEDVANHFKNSGIKALIVQMVSDLDEPGFGETVVKPPVKHDIPFPVFEITIGQTRSLAGWFRNQTARGVIISIDGPEVNPWQHYITTGWPIASIILLITTGIVLIAACYKLILTLWEKGWQMSIGVCVLSLIIVAMVIRFVWCIIDPFGVYKTAHFAWVQVGLTLPFALIIGNTLLITLYWHEMIRKTGNNIHAFLNKMLIPFLIFIFLFTGFELASSLARGFKLTSRALLIANSTVYAVVVTVVVSYFVITNIRITGMFRKYQNTLHSKKQKRLTKATLFVAGIALTMVIWVVPLIMIAAAKFLWAPSGFTAIWMVLLFGLNLCAFLQVLLIRAPTRPWKWIFCGLCMDDPAELLPTHGSSSLLQSTTNTHTLRSVVGSQGSVQMASMGADKTQFDSTSSDSYSDSEEEESNNNVAQPSVPLTTGSVMSPRGASSSENDTSTMSQKKSEESEESEEKS